jgi:Fe2+ transport system protein FeoA
MSIRQWVTSLSWRAIAKISCLIALLVAANFLAHGFADTLDFQIRPGNEDAVHRTITVSAVLYSILLALPFVPGAEVGLALMAVFGPPIAVLVYACTVAGLLLSFIAGRLFPLSVLVRFANDMRLDRTSKLLADIEPLSRQERLELLAKKAPNRLLPFVLRYRYVALAVALNIPGNFLIGGGGGIGLFAGISRLYTAPGYLLTIIISVAPVPIAVLVFGTEFLSN